MVTTDIQCHLIKKVVRLIRGGKRGPGQKTWQDKQGLYAWLRVSSHLMDTECEFAPCDGPAPRGAPRRLCTHQTQSAGPRIPHPKHRRSNTVEIQSWGADEICRHAFWVNLTQGQKCSEENRKIRTQKNSFSSLTKRYHTKTRCLGSVVLTWF